MVITEANRGVNFRAYQYFGVHRDTRKYVFRVYAPSADEVYLTSDATGWDDGALMNKISPDGVWELKLYTFKGIKNEKFYTNIEGMRYRYKIVSKGEAYSKCDPYSFSTDIYPEACSVVYTKGAFRFSDEKWREKTAKVASLDGACSQPLNIYELHIGSFLPAEGEGYLNYREVADKLIPYLKQMGYTHVELMPISEYLDDNCCGYFVTSFFSPTSRYGSPDDFKYFVNKLHNNGIGVILDWVPAHFSSDPFGLCLFDGTQLYGYDSGTQAATPWGSLYFDPSKKQACDLLASSAMYWLEEYHIDGLGFEAVSAMLYLDYNRSQGEWSPNKYGGNENLEGIELIKQLNYLIHKYYPHAITIADEAFFQSGVTRDVRADGLGFTFVRNNGWTDGMLDYISTDPLFRGSIHDKLTFPLMNLTDEHFILPVSHSAVSGGRGSLIERCFGEYEDKFANLRAFMTLMMTSPGKKHTFMGCEYGQFRQWNGSDALEWFMLDFDMHARLQRFCAELNHMYLKDGRLYREDYSRGGFGWVYPDLADKNVISYKRYDKEGRELLVVINFSGAEWKDFIVPVSGCNPGYRLMLNSQDREYGGGYPIAAEYKAYVENGKCVIQLESLPPLCGLIFEPFSGCC